MAVWANQNQNDEQKQQQKGQNSLNPLQTVGTASSGGAAPTGSPGAQQQSSNLAQQQQSGSGRFTNLQKYLQANQGGSQRIAQNITNSYDKQAQAVNQGIQAANGQLNSQTNPLQQQLGDQGSQQIQQGFTDPNAVLNDSTQTQNFQNMAGGLAQNVANVAGTQNLQQQALAQQNQNLQNTAGLAGTEQGRFQLLRNSVNNPGYTQGAQRLDQTLLQSQPSATNNLQTGLQGIAGGVNQNLQGLSADSINKINALKGLSQQRQDQWGNLLQNGTDNTVSANGATNTLGLGDIGAVSQQDLANAQNYTNVVNPQIQAAMANHTLTPELLAQIQGGNAPDLKQSLYGVDASQFFKPQTDVAANATNTIDQDTYNRYNALRQLSGQDQSGGSIFGGPATDVGTFKANGFDQTGFQNAVDQAQGHYEKQGVLDLISQLYPQLAPTLKNPTLLDQYVNNHKNPTTAVVNGVSNAITQSNPTDLVGNNIRTQISSALNNSGFKSAQYNQEQLAKMAAGVGNLFDDNGKNLNYEGLVNAINGAWKGGDAYGGGLDSLAAGAGGPYAAIKAYADTLAKQRGDTLGGAAAASPAPAKGGIVPNSGTTKVYS